MIDAVPVGEGDSPRTLRDVPDMNRELVLVFQAATGCRISEALGLRWTDVDFDNREATISRQLYQGRRDSAFAFQQNNGKPVPYTKLLKDVCYPALERAKVPRLGTHALRHSFASHRLAEGVHLPAVSATLGHASPAVTLRIYTHTIPTENRAALAVDLEAMAGDWVVAIARRADY